DLVVSGVHYGFQFTNNLMPQGTYGMLVAVLGEGPAALKQAFPDGIITGNVIVGGSASLYPAGNFFPSTWDQAKQRYPGVGARGTNGDQGNSGGSGNGGNGSGPPGLPGGPPGLPGLPSPPGGGGNGGNGGGGTGGGG